MAGHEPPTKQEGVKAVLRGIRRTIGTARAGKAPATADLLGADGRALPGQHDRQARPRAAVPGLCRGVPPRPSCARSRSPISPRSPTGCAILIRRSKGDQEGQGQEVAIPRGYRLRPVEAVQTWLAAAEISAGPGVPCGRARRTGVVRRRWRTTARRGS